jgi:hypothetical protein
LRHPDSEFAKCVLFLPPFAVIPFFDARNILTLSNNEVLPGTFFRFDINPSTHFANFCIRFSPAVAGRFSYLAPRRRTIMRDNRASEGYGGLSRPDEVLLHFIWQFRYYNHRELTTEAGAPIHIHYPGDPNTNQGPDFKNARITIDDRTLEGPVELHVRASDFLHHGHTGDPHYQNVILHVVWVNDTVVPPANIPILALIGRTPATLLPRYRQFMTSRSFVPCAPLLLTAKTAFLAKTASTPDTTFPVIPWSTLRNTLLHQRLLCRTSLIRTLMDENNPHWEQTLYQLIARSLGQPVNTDAFLTMAKSIPLNFLLRHRTDPARLQSLFMSHAASLDPPLSFHRMRPAHSPSVRLGQLADLLSNHSGRFTLLLESDQPGPLLRSLDAKGLGTATRHSIVINAFIPLLYAYAVFRQEPQLRDKALRWLHETPPEDNNIIRRWCDLGMIARTAADTQALLELRKNHCSEKKCLDCAIGRTLLTAAQPILTPPPPASENLPLPPGQDGYCT